MVSGTGPWFGTVTVSNSSSYPVVTEIATPDGTALATFTLPAFAASTFSSLTLLGAENGRGLVVQGVEAETCATEAVQRFTVTRGLTPGTADTVELPVPDGVDVSSVIVSQGTVFFDVEYDWSQVGTVLNVDWSPPGAEPVANSVYAVLVAYTDVCRPGRLSAAVKLVAPVATANGRTSDAHVIVTGYTALAESHGRGDVLHVPIVQANYSGWRTVLHITNYGTAPCTVTASFFAYPDGSPSGAPSQSVAAGATWNLDTTSVLPDGWLGTAQVVGPGCALAAAVSRVKPQQPWGTPVNMALSNLAFPRAVLTPTVYVPLVFQAYFNWNTGIDVTNAGDAPALVTVAYFDVDGDPIAETQLGPIPPNGMAFDYLTGTGGQLAQAIVTSSQPVIVSVDAVKYSGEGQDVGQALSYMGVNGPLWSSVIAVPLFQKAGAAGNDTSGFNLFNPSDGPTDVSVGFRDSTGAPVHDLFTAMPARGARTVYAPFEDALPNDFQGVVEAFSFGPAVAGVSNNVNYDVQADGSASFNAVSGHTTFRVHTGPSTAFKNNVPALVVVHYLHWNGNPPLANEVPFVFEFGPFKDVLLNDASGKAVFTVPPQNGSSGEATVCVDANVNDACDPGEQTVVVPLSWSP